MEININDRILSVNDNKNELDKFARRLIRAVSRMLLLEKRDEEEVWEGLRKQTGFDCKELWIRMRALTMKKLDRLLAVEDQVERLPVAARMSITDWLLFDTVLVHQDFDVIGMTETSSEDRQVLVDLFELVEKYKLEYLAGDQLADAWSAATIDYNKNNRQCTPMLLQRRWFQLKLVTRARFYNYWFKFKGVAKKAAEAAPYKPTPLQTKIAKSYKHLVVTPTSIWEELIETKLVILREEFVAKGMQKENALVETKEDVPDVICIEQKVETIDLDNDSDVELDYRISQQNENKDLATIKIKQEPRDECDMDIDESVPYQNRQDKISYFAEAVMEATTLELEELDLAENVDPTDKQDINDTPPPEVIEINEDEKRNDDSSDEVIEVTSNEAEITVTVPEEERTVLKDNTTFVIENQTDAEIENIIEDENTVVTSVDNELMETINLKMEDDIEIVQVDKEPEQVLPQIKNIFGGVNDTTEALSTISKLAAQITNPVNKSFIIKTSDLNKNANDLSSEPVENFIEDITDNGIVDVSNVQNNSSVVHNLKKECDINLETNKNSWFGELSNDIDFVDDGIAYEDVSSHNGGIKVEIEIDAEKVMKTEESNEYNKFDKKLLMVPLVNTVKLDDMGILPIHLLEHIEDKWLIDVISSKSKVKIPKIDDTEIESDTEHVTETIKKVKLSSYLLQKPRNRKYNPIQLCKNPDFNTRLKRLNVGFFSSYRNRLLLKSCQPVTIDVSKAFEDRLVDGTIYLKITDDDYTHRQNEIPDSAENYSVLPSAMPVQSLIDNTRGATTPIIYNAVNINPVEVITPACQRNKIINLPDITEIRRINQNLLTAQVTPIQVKHSSTDIENTQVAVNNIVKNVHKRKTVAGPASCKRPAYIRGENNASSSTLNISSNTDTQVPRSTQLLKGHKIVLWKSREIRPEVPWYSNVNGLYSPDTLLALDSLNKMLCYLTEGDKVLTAESKSIKKKQKKMWSKDHKSLPKDKKTVQNDDTDEVQIISETHNSLEDNETKKDKNSVAKPKKKPKPVFCCWARDRISQMNQLRKRKPKHTCPFPLCLCCCKFELLEYYKKARGTDSHNLPARANMLATKSDHTVEQKNVAVETDPDVAELIPIQKTTKSLITDRDGSNSNNANNSDAEFIPCKTVSSETMNHSDKSASQPLCNEISAQGELGDNMDLSLTLGAEVSIITSKSSSSTINNESNISNPIKSPRIRVRHSVELKNNCKRYEDSHSKKRQTRSEEEQVVNIVKDSSLTEVKNPISATNINSSEVNIDSMQSTSQDSIYAKTTPNSVNNLYLCVEPLVSQAATDVTKTYVSGKGGRPKFSDNFTETTSVQNNINIVMGLLTNKGLGKPVKTQTTKSINSVVVTPQKGSSQKMIYLNSKQIAELPSDNPIHLGQNKILLTTLKFPRNFKAFESYQRNLRQTMALPKGITLKLLLDGRLTYTLNIKSVISDEFLAAMPQLIEAIQRQIDSDSVLTTKNVTTINSCPNNEVICLSDEESSDTAIKNNADITNVENNQAKTDFENSKENMSTVNVEKNTENVFVESIISRSVEAVPEISSEISCTVDNSTLEELNTEIAATSKGTNKEEINKNIPNIRENTPSEINPDILETPNANITDMELNENKCKDSNNSKTKNILSDLMAMSGILPTEVTQESPSNVIPSDASSVNLAPIAPSQATPQLTLPHHSAQPISTQIIPSHSLEDSNAVLSIASSGISQTFTPITSLAELKYACLNNASFFKLDMETRLLVPINVCMKSIMEKKSMKPVRNNKHKVIVNGPTIDLTDDDVSVMPKQLANNSLLRINNPIDISDIDKSDDMNNVSDDTTKNVKPLLLIRAGNNLQEKVKKIRKNMLKLRRKRKHELTKSSNSDFGLTSISEIPDSSSDEEPLANLAIKKRRNEKENLDNVSDNTDLPTEVNSVPDTPGEITIDFIEELAADTEEDTADLEAESRDPPEVVMEYLDEDLLKEDEACILGV